MKNKMISKYKYGIDTKNKKKIGVLVPFKMLSIVIHQI